MSRTTVELLSRICYTSRSTQQLYCMDVSWVNQKGYVTCFYNVTHDAEITITNLLHIPKYLATVLRGLQLGEPERTCNMFL